VWVTGSYDPELNLTYWGIGNPGPDWNGDQRPGDNLYSSSVVALDADTGNLKWHYQFTPHDEFDYDSTQVPVSAEMEYQGRARKLMLWANRNGFYYVLDRTSGQFLTAKPFVKVTWADGFDERGRPKHVPGMVPSREGTLISPAAAGATNWYSPSFSPRTGLFYITAWADVTSTFVKGEQEYVEGRPFVGGMPKSLFGQMRGEQANTHRPEEGHGEIVAVDAKTGEKKWVYKMVNLSDAGILTTASDLLFSGGREEYFFALDARTGALLWKASTGGPIMSAPISYSVAGKQYVAISAGNAMFVYGLR